MALCLLIAIAAVVTPVWRVARYVITIAHEGDRPMDDYVDRRNIRVRGLDRLIVPCIPGSISEQYIEDRAPCAIPVRRFGGGRNAGLQE